MSKKPLPKGADEKTLTARVIQIDDFFRFMEYMPNPDEVLRDAGEAISIYREMKTDARIKSLLKIAKSAILNYPIHLKTDNCRKQIVDFVAQALEKKVTLYKVAKRLLNAVDYGYSAVEVIWGNSDGWWLPSDVVQRKPERFAFDAYSRLRHRTSSGTYEDLYNQKYKWLVWRHDKDPENPYGTSALKACYWAWKFKKVGLEFWLMAEEKFAVPSILALFEYPGSADDVRNRAQEIANMLSGITSGSSAAVGNVKEAKPITADGKLSEFKTLTDWCDTQFAYAITYQSLAVQEAENGTRAQAQVHADTFLSATKENCRDIQEELQELVDWIVELNFGPDEIVPQVEFDLSEYASWEVVRDAIDRGLPVSKQALYERYGLPKPKGDDDVFTKPGQSTMGVAVQGAEIGAPAPQTDVQSTALNGAQVTALLELAAKVSNKEIPLETARAMAQAAFPLVSKDEIDRIFDPLKNFTPAPATKELADDVKKNSRILNLQP